MRVYRSGPPAFISSRSSSRGGAPSRRGARRRLIDVSANPPNFGDVASSLHRVILVGVLKPERAGSVTTTSQTTRLTRGNHVSTTPTREVVDHRQLLIAGEWRQPH